MSDVAQSALLEDMAADLAVIAADVAGLQDMTILLRRVERRSVRQARCIYGNYALTTLVVATSIISNRQRLGYDNAELLQTMLIVDAVLCVTIWLLVFILRPGRPAAQPIRLLRPPRPTDPTRAAGADHAR